MKWLVYVDIINLQVTGIFSQNQKKSALSLYLHEKKMKQSIITFCQYFLTFQTFYFVFYWDFQKQTNKNSLFLILLAYKLNTSLQIYFIPIFSCFLTIYFLKNINSKKERKSRYLLIYLKKPEQRSKSEINGKKRVVINSDHKYFDNFLSILKKMDDKPSLETMTEEANKSVNRLKDIENHPNWKKNSDKPCQMFTMQVDGRTASKGMIVVNFSLEQVAEFLKDVTVLQKLNPTINKIQVVHQYTEHLNVNYQSYDGMWPVAGRDMILVSVRKNQEGKIYLAAKSVNYPCPEVKGIVRGELFIGGWILEKIDENKTKVSYFSDIDIKGSVPGMIKNKLTERQASMPAKLEAQMNKKAK